MEVCKCTCLKLHLKTGKLPGIKKSLNILLCGLIIVYTMGLFEKSWI